MKSRHMNKKNLNNTMKRNLALELRGLGLKYTRSGTELADATYQELKWTYALELAKREE